MLRDDGAGGNDDDGPVELCLELGNNLLGDLAEGGEWAEGNADEEGLALVSVGLGELDQLGGVDEHLDEVLLELGVVDLKLEKHLGALVFDVGRLGLLCKAYEITSSFFIILLRALNMLSLEKFSLFNKW